MNKRRTAVGIVIAVIAAVILVTVIVKWRGGKDAPEATTSGPTPVFDSDVYLEKGTPPADKILAALGSDSALSVQSAHILLKRIVFKDKLNWPSDLSKGDVYKHVERNLKSGNLKIVRSAISLVDPRISFGRAFYRTEEDVQLVKQAIKRWNATQSEEDDFYQFYELVLNEKGEPVRLKPIAGGHIE